MSAHERYKRGMMELDDEIFDKRSGWRGGCRKDAISGWRNVLKMDAAVVDMADGPGVADIAMDEGMWNIAENRLRLSIICIDLRGSRPEVWVSFLDL